MRKVIKILGKAIATIVIVAAVLPLLLALLLGIPAVQNSVVRKATRIVSEKLDTEVRIGRVEVGYFGKVRVRDLYVEDYQKDTLLYAGRVEAFVTGLGIFGGGVSLNRAEIAGAKLCLRETPEGVMNIKQLIDRLSDPDKPKKGAFRLAIRKATIRDMELCLERLQHRDPPYGIDFGHMHLYDLAARVDDLMLDGPALSMTVGALSARERSGFVLDHLSGRFYMNNGCLGFEEAHLVTERSNVTLPYVALVGGSWADYKDFISQVRIEAAVRNATLATDDVAYFAPKLRDRHLVLSGLDADASGEVDDLRVKLRSLRIGEGISLAGDLAATGLPDLDRARFDVRLTRLAASAEAVDDLLRDLGGRSLPEGVRSVLERAGAIGVTLRFEGSFDSFDAKAEATTDAGTIVADLQMRPRSGGLRSIRGGAVARNLKVGALLGRRTLVGDATVDARIDGVVGRGRTDAAVTGRIERFGFKGYVYDSLRFDGRLRNREFDGRIVVRDPNLRFDFAGLVDLNDSVPRYDFALALDRADLAALHINPRDSVSRLSARLVAKGSGRSLDDLNGRIRITDAVYAYNDKRIGPAELTLTGENSADSKFVELRSDFADATFRSKTSYRTVFDFLRRRAAQYLPSIAGRGSRAVRAGERIAVADDYSLLSVLVRDFNPVADAVAPGLQIAEGSSLKLLFNPANNRLSFNAHSEYVERRNMLATRLNVNASNRGDSLTLYASAEDLFAGMLHLPRLSLTGGARQGRIQLTTGFDDTTRRFSGLVALRAEIADERSATGRNIDLQILPSHITRGDKTWGILARRILYDTTRVVIDRFYVRNSEQSLLVDGVASRSRADSVTLTLRNFDLAPLTQIADRMGYVIEGRTNGFAVMKSALRNGELTADIALDSLSVNGIGVPPLRLVSGWDFARSRAGVTVTERHTRDTVVRGFYDPAQVRYYARLTVDSLDMGLLDPVLSGVVSGTRGFASADLVLQGRRRDATLTGGIRVRDLATTVDFTQVTYTLPAASLEVAGNRLRARNATIYDPQGNRARLDIDLDLQHLSNIAYDIRVRPEELLVLDTDAADNDAFYGRVYATGSVRVAGDKGQVTMDIAAATDEGSSFFMPLSGKSNISYADFVTFVAPKEDEEEDVVARKRRSFERRRTRSASAGSDMDISLALDVRPNVEVELTVSGNTLKARGAGLLNLQIEPKTGLFEMYGDYALSDGSFRLSLMNLYNKNFVIEPGSTIQWTGSPTDALLDIDAVYKLKASLQPLLQGTSDKLASDRSVPVECVIHLGGRLTNPSVTFDVRVPSSDPETQTVIANALSTPESVDQQFASLLVFNSFMAENIGSNANLGASMGVGTGLEFLSGMLNNWIGDYGLVLRYRPKSETAGEEVDFGLSKSLINNRLFVELEGNYLIDNKQAVNSSMSNFMGEAYVTYLIDRSGVLKLKAFTQTIDRFDENQGLQETGIGIYFKEDFDNFRDFRRRMKERFTNKKRRARREARKTAAAEDDAAADAAAGARTTTNERQTE